MPEKQKVLEIIPVSDLRKSDVCEHEGIYGEVISKEKTSSGYRIRFRLQTKSESKLWVAEFEDSDTIRLVAPATVFTKWWMLAKTLTYVPKFE